MQTTSVEKLSLSLLSQCGVDFTLDSRTCCTLYVRNIVGCCGIGPYGMCSICLYFEL